MNNSLPRVFDVCSAAIYDQTGTKFGKKNETKIWQKLGTENWQKLGTENWQLFQWKIGNNGKLSNISKIP